LSTKRKRRAIRFPKKPSKYYINSVVLLFFLALLVILAKIFIFDTIPSSEESNKTVAVLSKKASIEDTYHKYEEKTKALEIEYVDDMNTTKIEKVAPKKPEQSEKKFSFFDDTSKAETKPPVEITKKEAVIEAKSKADTVVLKEKKEIKEIKEKTPKEKYPEIEKVKKETKKQPIEEQPTKKRESGSARLAIIIDDVTTKKQFDTIQSIGYPITMAFMPPTNTHKNSATIAQSLNMYMVHLPLEATTRSAEESETLHVGDDMATIQRKIKQLKTLYPKAIYYNNHTGSKFTADENSMDMLMEVLKNNNIQFIDSRTTPKSVVKQYAIKHGMRYIGRNIFLDNTPKKEYIKAQLQKAVEIAKKTGSAIAIGHPYGATMEALRESKEILNGLDIVMIDKI